MICNGMQPQETPVVKEKRAKFRQKKKMKCQNYYKQEPISVQENKMHQQ